MYFLQERPYWRAKQNSENSKLFKKFKKEIQAKYENEPYIPLYIIKYTLVFVAGMSSRWLWGRLAAAGAFIKLRRLANSYSFL